MEILDGAKAHYKAKYNISIREHIKENGAICIEGKQGKMTDDVYLTIDELGDIIRSLYQSIYDSFSVEAVVYTEVPHHAVSCGWITTQMGQQGYKAKSLASDLGLSKYEVADHVTGRVAMTNTDKAMYYYFFVSKW